MVFEVSVGGAVDTHLERVVLKDVKATGTGGGTGFGSLDSHFASWTLSHTGVSVLVGIHRTTRKASIGVAKTGGTG